MLRPGPDIDPRYLFHAVWANTFRRAGASNFTGSAGQKRLPASFFERYKVPLPPLAEQRRIAAVLDKADGVRRKRRESLRLLDEFLRSAFLEMFGDPVRNEKGWEVVRLGDRLSFLTSGSRGWARYYALAGRPFLRIQNVGRNELKLDDLAFVDPPLGAEADRTRAQPGDVLLSITADLGRTAVVPAVLAGAHINQHLALLRVRDAEPIYVAEFLASAGGRRQFASLNRQAVKAGLNFDDIRGLRVPVPPPELQQQFASLHQGARRPRERFSMAIDMSQELFDSLAQQAFAHP